ncbi:hypothetical protein DPMN_034108 [Dreissena polymorpha]|uniref:Uncharacterized protein n=1 Tax=Dreissena polymorpha TaxID=45954 RepID=A0A9D4RJF9_DREPO|nr:hypothetical protein DPMN_034108 [Dreissena polymorpha]
MKTHGYDCNGNETDIVHCNPNEFIPSCSNGTSAGFNCCKIHMVVMYITKASNGSSRLKD